MANISIAAWYCGSVQWTAVAAWAAATAYAAGDLIRQNAAPTVGNERVFVCIVAGNSHATTEPTWTVTKGAKTTDNTVTWQECTGQPGVNGDDTNTPTWAQQKAFSSVISLGLIIQSNATTDLFICSTAGTIGASEPTWNTTPGNTTNDNTAVWTCINATATYANWAAPFPRAAPASATNWAAAGNTVFVADDHNETQTTAMSFTGGTLAAPIYFVCIDAAGSIPPAAADLSAGGTISMTGGADITIPGSANANIYMQGLDIVAGTGASASRIIMGAGTSNHAAVFRDCLLKLNTTSASGLIGSGFQRGGLVRLINTPTEFGATTQSIGMSCRFEWYDTPSAIQGTVPASLFGVLSSTVQSIYLDGVDLSAAGAGKTIFAGTLPHMEALIVNCALGASVTLAATVGIRGSSVTVVTVDSAGTNYIQQLHLPEGVLTQETTIVRTGGASDGTTDLSWKIATTASAIWAEPFASFPVAYWNTTTGSSVTVTVFGIWNSASLPDNDDIWLGVEYFGSASNPMASFKNDGKATILTTAASQTADSSEAWDSQVTARANTTAYSLGDTIKVASNSGRVFFCTTAGTTAGSEPAGYASAVDGGSVTDNTAVFRAGVRFSLDVTLTSPDPAMEGYLYARVYAAPAAANTYYVCPKLSVA